MATRAGQAFIVIAPSFKGFKTKTETWVKTNMRAIDIQVNPVMSKKPLVVPKKSATMKVDVDRSAFDRSIRSIESRLDKLTRGRFLINVGIALTPLAAPALAAAAGGLIAGGGIAGAGIAGIVGMATVGAASLKRLTERQDAVTKATATSTVATKALGSARRSLASAESAAASARISAARQVAGAERSLGDAQDRLLESQNKVKESLADLHAARRQAIRDLQDLRERSRDDALSIEGAELGLIDAQAELTRVQGLTTSTALDLRKAKLGVAEAEDRLSDARKQGADNAKELAKAEKGGTNSNPGVVSARKALEDAEKDRDAAKNGVRNARRELSEARADASRQVAESARAVADAASDLAAAQAAASKAQADQANALAALSPAQKKAAAGIDRLKTSWGAFQDKTDPFVLPALVKGMDALGMGLAPLAAFMEPVSNAAGKMFTIFGNAAASKGFQTWSKDFGIFTSVIMGDATTGILNVARGFGTLLTAFMPLSTDMSGGLVVLTEKFANWSAGLEGSSGFNGFVAYVRENGPLLLSTLGDIVTMIVDIGIAIAPTGTKMLEIIGVVARFVSGFAEANPTITAGVVGFIALSSGVAAVAGPLAKVTSMVGGLGKGGGALWKGAKAANGFRKGLFDVTLASKEGATAAQKHGAGLRLYASYLKDSGKKAFGAARSTAGFVVEQGRLAGAYIRTTALAVKDNAIKLVSAARTTAVNVATRAWATGQWLLNAALTANPLVLVGVGLVAFGAIVVTMYRKVGWFRRGVDALWSGLKKGFFWVRDNWKTLLIILTGPIGLAVVTITDNFGKIRKGVGKVKDAFGAAKDGIEKSWGKIAKAVTKPLTLIKKALNGFFKGIDWIATKLGFKNTFNFRFDVDDAPNTTGNANSGPQAHGPTTFAQGGVLPGWTPGRDVHHFTSPTAGNLHLSGGEAVMRPEWTAAVGGPKAVAAMNKAAITGQAFAKGGVVWPTKSKHWTTYAGHDGIDLNGPGNGMGDPYFAAKSGTVAYTGWGRGYGDAVFLATNGGPTLTYGHSSRVDVKAGQEVRAGQRMGLIGSTGRSTGPHLHFGLVGEGPDRGAAAVRFLSGASMPSGKKTGDGDGFNPIGQIKKLLIETKKMASSIDAGPFGSMLKKTPGRFAEMAFDWVDDKKKAAKTGALEGLKHGINPFDDGGLASARGLLVKNTVRPERVLSPAQTAAFENAMAGMGGHGGLLEIVGELEMVNGKAYIKGVAKEAIEDDNYQTRRGLRTPKR